jgi:hypothetical protein
MLAFDIETGPLPDDQLPAFDRDRAQAPSNWKDPEKIERFKDEAEAAWREKLALSPLTGRVVAIGSWSTNENRFVVDGLNDEPGPEAAAGSEASLLACWWNRWAAHRHSSVVGHCILTFDLPFLYQRSLLLGVAVAPLAIDRRGYWHESFVDTNRLWNCGERNAYTKLDTLLKAFGLPGKTEGVEGKDFHRLWFEDREKAVEYLNDDVMGVLRLAEAMGV